MMDSGLIRKTDLSAVCDLPLSLNLYEAICATADDVIIGVRFKRGAANLMYGEFSLGTNLLVDEDDTIVEFMRALADPNGDAAKRFVKTWDYEPEALAEYRPHLKQSLARIEAGKISVSEWEHPDSPDHPDNW